MSVWVYKLGGFIKESRRMPSGGRGMTKQELIDLIEDSGELVKEEGQLYHTKYLFDEESIDKLADALITKLEDLSE